jgi:hypothetical protein
MTLEGRIETLRKDIKSDRLSMSIGELVSLYEKGELDIHPKFQRILRWTPEQKTKLIESLLLRIPVPPVFVAQDSAGKWDVVDGLQRLGTIFEFMGVLRAETDLLEPALCLLGTELLPELSGYRFSSHEHSLTVPQQLDFKRSRLDINIVLNESDPSAKYELFERLNTGGSLASPQEVRNCILVWLNEEFFDWFRTILVGDEHFRACVQLPERLEGQQYRSELVLRFLVFGRTHDSDLSHIDDLGDFLNRQNRALARDSQFDRAAEARRFAETFRLLNESVGPNAFRKFDSARGEFQGPFLISAYEAVALGLAHNLERWLETPDKSPLLSKIKQLWAQQEFIGHIGIGVPARTRIRHSIPFSREFFRP